MAGPLLLTGASGFVGRQVLRELRGWDDLRLLVHHRVPGGSAGRSLLSADLEAPVTLKDICSGVQTLVHLASHIGDDPARCERVNARGTEALVAAARIAGVRRIIYLSNAAVYGYAVHRGADETSVTVAPATPVSRSRVGAERAVLAAGGIVIRPFFVYGEGDTRFIPAIAGALRELPFLVNGGRARLSVIGVSDLARVIVALATRQTGGFESGVYHATDGCPVTLRAIVDLIADGLGIPAPRLSLPYPLGRWLIRLGRLGRSWTRSDAHRLFLVSQDHFYDSSRIWRVTGLARPAPIGRQFESCLEWYRSLNPLGRTA